MLIKAVGHVMNLEQARLEKLPIIMTEYSSMDEIHLEAENIAACYPAIFKEESFDKDGFKVYYLNKSDYVDLKGNNEGFAVTGTDDGKLYFLYFIEILSKDETAFKEPFFAEDVPDILRMKITSNMQFNYREALTKYYIKMNKQHTKA